MATIEQLEEGVRKAYEMGRMEDARLLGEELIRLRGEPTLPVTEVTADQTSQMAAGTPPEQTGRGIIGGLVEAVTGRERATEATRTLPEWTSMPELNSFSFQSALTGLGTLLAGPEEVVQVIQANFPATQIMQDEKGNFILRSSIDGRDYAIPPGFSMGDIPRAVGGIAAFTPAGRARTVLGAGGASAATQAGIEASQMAAGGEFAPEEVAMAGGFGAAVPGAMRLAQTATPPIRRLFGAEPTPPRVEPTMGATQPPPVGGVPQPGMPLGELAATTRAAAGEAMLPSGRTRAMQVLAQESMPDPKTLDAAKRLGIDQYLQPDHVTTNQVYRELSQAVKSVPGSQARSAEMDGFRAIGERADKLVSDLGGTKDYSTLSARIQKQMQSNVDELAGKTESLFKDTINKAILPRTEINPQNVLNYLIQRGEDLGGLQNLSAMEKEVFRKLSPQRRKIDGVEVEVFPTYALLDDVRKDIGSAYKNSGPFKDADRASLDQLYGPLAADQRAVAQRFGVGEAFDAANKAVQVRKAIERDMTSLFGKQLHLSMVDNVTGAMKALAKGDEKKLINLLKAVPADMRQEVVASGLNTAFGRAALDKKLGFNEYATWYQGLLQNKQAYTALMSNLPPEARKQLSDLYRVSRGIALASRERIVTGRIQAAQQALFDNADNLVSKIVEAGQRGAVAGSIEAAGRAVGLPGAGIATWVASALTKQKTPMQKAADDLLSSREFLQASRDVAQGQNQQAAERIAKSRAFSKFAKEMGMPREMDYRIQWLLSTMQSGRQFGEEEQ